MQYRLALCSLLTALLMAGCAAVPSPARAGATVPVAEEVKSGGLTWSPPAGAFETFDEAVLYCTTGALTGWRLPTQQEAAALLSAAGAALRAGKIWPAGSADWYWTSTPRVIGYWTTPPDVMGHWIFTLNTNSMTMLPVVRGPAWATCVK